MNEIYILKINLIKIKISGVDENKFSSVNFNLQEIVKCGAKDLVIPEQSRS